MRWRRLIEFTRHSERDIARDVDDELHFHLRAREDDLVARGWGRDEARRQAERDFGDVDDARRYATNLDQQTVAIGKRRDHMHALRQDLIYAIRRLWQAPAFTAAALATLALGIGATTGIFSVVNGVLLRPLPYPEATQLYRVWSVNATGGNLQASVSAMDLDDWRAQRSQIADLGGFWHQPGSSGLDLTGSGEPQHLASVFVTPGFFSTMGVQPVLGRLPREDELVRGGNDRFLVLSHTFWQRHFGGRADAVGSTLRVRGEAFTVLGVLPRSFDYPTAAADVFASFSIFTDDQVPRLRFVRVLGVVARARPGVSESAVSAELQRITSRVAAQYPENAAWDQATVMPLKRSITGDVSAALWVLFGAVGLLLLIACVNVASLQLARATARRGEVAVRVALGATRGRLLQQLLTESVVLSLCGGVLGSIVALGVVKGVMTLASGQLPQGSVIAVDLAVLGFSALLSLGAGLLFGLTPAWRASTQVQPALRAARGTSDSLRTRLRHGLVVAEVALAMMLVIGGGLMLRSFRSLTQVDVGFSPAQLLVFNYTLSDDRGNNSYLEIYSRILERVRALPGVVSAGATSDAPFGGSGEQVAFTPPGYVVAQGQEMPTSTLLQVSDGYFATIKATLRSGREFAPTDRGDAPAVVVVNTAFERRWFPGESATGKRLMLGGRVSAEIVGVVNDIRQTEVATEARETVYLHVHQNGRVRMNLMVRTEGPPLAIAPAVKVALREIDPNLPIRDIYTMDSAVRSALSQPRLLAVLLAAFGVAGLALGAIGLYGVLAYLVQQRRRELGVRLALGAPRHHVLRMIVGQGMRLTATGVVLGAVGALALGRLLSAVLFGVAPDDPLTYAGVAALMLGVAWMASLLPARRAASTDVVATLRND